MRLHAVDDDDPVGVERGLAEADRDAVLRRPEHRGLHRRVDRHAHRGLGDAILREDLGLPLGRGAAVAAHRGDEEGLRARVLQDGDHFADDDSEVADAPAARAHGDARAGLQGRREVAP